MLTRGETHRTYQNRVPQRVMNPGFVKITKPGGTNTNSNVVQTWAIARPGSSPGVEGAPFYLTTYRYPPNSLIRSGASEPLNLTQPNLEMDPTNPNTWQRQYRFTN